MSRLYFTCILTVSHRISLVLGISRVSLYRFYIIYLSISLLVSLSDTICSAYLYLIYLYLHFAESRSRSTVSLYPTTSSCIRAYLAVSSCIPLNLTVSHRLENGI